jgi:TIR domain-containing protein
MVAFLSYSSADKSRARRVAEIFRHRGIDVWIDEAELRPGDMLAESITSAISRAGYFVILITAASVQSRWVKFELNNVLPRVIDGGAKVVPLVFDNAVVPDSLRGYLWADCRTDEDAAKAVTRAIHVAVGNAWDSGGDNDGWIPKYGIRLVEKNVLTRTGQLGPVGRPYVMIGDYDQLARQTLRSAIERLFVGRYFDLIEHAKGEWVAIVFEIGRVFSKTYDLLPATWKAMYRILTDERRLGLFEASDDARRAMGRPPRDYYDQDSGPWESWVRSELREQGRRIEEERLETLFGLHSTCFKGDGLGANGARIFLMRNQSVSMLNSRTQELGCPDDGVRLE